MCIRDSLRSLPQGGESLQREELDLFIKATAAKIARILHLKKK